tara:strand:- start:1025 stop:1450 length:426 start_codon:yes stop_codon:yes gene_type:complete
MPPQWRPQRVSMFGSSANGLGIRSSDIDMCLIFPPSTRDYVRMDQSTAIDQMAHRLIFAGMMQVGTRKTARVPIITFKDPMSGLDCDICMHNELAVRNTELIRVYVQFLDPTGRVMALGHLIKSFAKQRGINEVRIIFFVL